MGLAVAFIQVAVWVLYRMCLVCSKRCWLPNICCHCGGLCMRIRRTLNFQTSQRDEVIREVCFNYTPPKCQTRIPVSMFISCMEWKIVVLPCSLFFNLIMKQISYHLVEQHVLRKLLFVSVLQSCISRSHSPQSIAEVSEGEFPSRLLRRKIPCW